MNTLRRVIRTRGVRWLVSYGWRLINARVRLRKCNSLARSVTLNGRAAVRNQGFIRIADGAVLNGDTVRLEFFVFPGGRLEIGRNTQIDYGSSILCVQSVTVGDDCMIAAYTRIMDSDFHNVRDKSANMAAEPVHIGNRVWIGPRVTILKGVKIGDNAVVTANSLVTRDVPPNTLVTGVPARVIRQLDERQPAVHDGASRVAAHSNE